ncbi:hypothetical protein BN133_4237 [Cronobacter dublinensis 582]|nr:hypothetical protein BN133_4237 [Cronobacter dublinensis 582]
MIEQSTTFFGIININNLHSVSNFEPAFTFKANYLAKGLLMLINSSGDF